MSKPEILSMTLDECRALSLSLGEKKFRGEQLYGWMQKGAPLSEMKNLPTSFREKIATECDYRLPEIAKKQVSAKDGTVKYLMKMTDGECVESVFMRYEHGNTVCVSCQAGCRMGCKFCASTLRGKARDLTAGEILGQIVVIQRDTGERVGGIVMMGIGEPLDNYDNTVKFLRLVSSPEGLNIGLRHISVSTCGLIPGIKKLSEEGLPVTLSISLHASNDLRRSSLMPVNNKYPISSLMAACREYFEKTGRRVSFEYTLISGENDSEADAKALAALLRKGINGPSHINLIMLNKVDETGFSAPDRKGAERFKNLLCDLGMNATIRRRLGSDIDASCGQLRLNNMEE
ncbi:MAG: 23S rRNA (adenine(2503)-C(2))-methyltransferase RlmN [Ruminococcaceae bacterium]|nr:23S rRNA (adenine(2503)-C(2))-methyltransferase RlmN [Oscillospiraceae bacterium]